MTKQEIREILASRPFGFGYFEIRHLPKHD